VPYDKLAHSVNFTTLAVLLWFGTGGRWPVLLFLVVSAIGGLDELHQSTLPGRVADFYDYLTDTVAAGLVITLLEKNKMALEQFNAAWARPDRPAVAVASINRQLCRLWCQRQAVSMISPKSVYFGVQPRVVLALAAEATSTAGSPARRATTE